MSNKKSSHIVSDHLYELAYKFYDEKPWEVISEEQIFAVKMSDGVNVYVQMVGKTDPIDRGMFIYDGDESLKRIRRFYELPIDIPMHMLAEASAASDGIILRFKDRETYPLPDENLSSIDSYLKRFDSDRLTQRRVPLFQYKYPYQISNIFDDNNLYGDYLGQVIEATIHLSKMIRAEVLSLPTAKFKNGYLLEKTAGGYIPVEYINFPENDLEYPLHYAKAPTELISKLIDFPKVGTVEIEMTIVADSYNYITIDEETGGEINNHRQALSICSGDDSDVFTMIVLSQDLKDDQKDLQQLTKLLTFNNTLPEKIYVQSNRVAAYLEDLCQKLGIKVVLVDELEKSNFYLNQIHRA